MRVFAGSQVRWSGIAYALLFAWAACAPVGDPPAPDEPETGFVAQALGSCGTTTTCLAHTACASWDRDTPGDGLGYTTTSSFETGAFGSLYCNWSSGCSGETPDELCPGDATARRNALIAARPGISAAALNGFTVGWEEINSQYSESGCGPFDQGCARDWTYNCGLHINSFPTPITAVRAWCPCAQFAQLDCLGGSVVTGGNAHTCAIVGGGVQCWGANSDGQLGNNSTMDSFQRVAVSGLSSGVQIVTSGGSHSCAIVSNGAATCWGDNASGQLGNNSTADSKVPVNVSGLSTGVQTISGGDRHTCAIVNGLVKCWGANSNGQLGDGTTSDHITPGAVSGVPGTVQAITAGGWHSCAIVGGAAKCWGLNLDGQVGNGSPGDSTIAVPVSGLGSGVQAISAGARHTCALVGGGVKCWGSNASGQLGNNSLVSSMVPVPVTGLASGVQAIAAGHDHTCALTTAGSVQCWGANTAGQLGDGTLNQRVVPFEVVGVSAGAQLITAGYQHTCAIAGGRIKCWGLNGNGQLAAQTPLQSPLPLLVPELGCQSVGGALQCYVAGCADGSAEQTFSNGMVGCAGAVAFANRNALCSPGFQAATATQWTANRGGGVPSHHYWTNDLLRYNGTSAACFVSTTVGTDCGATTPMRVCTAAGSDPEGNFCNWGHCGLEASAPDQFFGGCASNATAGTVCVPAP